MPPDGLALYATSYDEILLIELSIINTNCTLRKNEINVSYENVLQFVFKMGQLDLCVVTWLHKLA